MATHSSVLAWRIPGIGEPSGLLSVGSHRVGHDWSDLAAAVAAAAGKYLNKKEALHLWTWWSHGRQQAPLHVGTNILIYQKICNQKIEIFQLKRLLWPAHDLNQTLHWLEWSVSWPVSMHCTSALAIEEGNAFRNKKTEDIVIHIEALRNFTLQALKDSNKDANLLNSNVSMIKKKKVPWKHMAIDILTVSQERTYVII